MRSAPAIGFEYRPSRALFACIATVTVLALIAVATSGLPLWAIAASAIATIAYGVAASWRFRHPGIAALTWRGDGGVSIRFASRGGGGEVQAELHEARVLGFLIVLHLRWPRGRASLWLLPDNLDTDTRRRLRVRLGSGDVGASVNADNI